MNSGIVFEGSLHIVEIASPAKFRLPELDTIRQNTVQKHWFEAGGRSTPLPSWQTYLLKWTLPLPIVIIDCPSLAFNLARFSILGGCLELTCHNMILGAGPRPPWMDLLAYFGFKAA